MEIVDTHQHLWDLDLFQYSWLDSIPSLRRTFRMGDYLEATQDLHIVKSVHLECDVDEPFVLAETLHILSLANQENPLAAVVAAGRPEKPGFRAYLDQIAGHRLLKGIRRVLHTQPDELSQTPLFAENLRLLPEYGLSYDLCVLARQMPLAIRLARECPRVSMILDHCGVPAVKERALDPWRDHIREIAGYENVVCKISGLVAYADPQRWTPRDLAPYVEHVIECFGWDRVMFGSDWPVCTVSASLAQWVKTLSELTCHAGEAERQKLFHDNAVRVYRLN